MKAHPKWRRAIPIDGDRQGAITLGVDKPDTPRGSPRPRGSGLWARKEPVLTVAMHREQGLTHAWLRGNSPHASHRQGFCRRHRNLGRDCLGHRHRLDGHRMLRGDSTQHTGHRHRRHHGGQPLLHTHASYPTTNVGAMFDSGQFR